MSEDLAIDVKNITKVFGDKTVVDNISLSVKKGTIFGFLGSNGSGKTTTIRMICGLLTPTSGSGTCLGYDIKTQSYAIKNKIGYMPQKFSFYNGLTVIENLRFVAGVYQLRNPNDAINAIIEDLDLAPYKNIQASGLSGGWKQRLSLACCLIHSPELLFLDEPTAGVDPKARKEFWDYLHKISANSGTTILVTTHYMDEAEKCFDLAYINLGKLLYSGEAREIISFSKVKSYMVECERKDAIRLSETIEKIYPKLLATFVNNDLRISSIDAAALNGLISAESAYEFKSVTPNFEEVFIGLIP
ncbi:MAG: transporter ATP-binding protein [Pseudomonadota bacterium]|jgi:ABC-2 type transport system ATP-binding protein